MSKEKSKISDAVLKLVNITKELTRHIDECGIRYITYNDVQEVEDAIDIVVKETNLKHQSYICEHGEQKGQVLQAFWSEFVRADDPKAYEEKEDA